MRTITSVTLLLALLGCATESRKIQEFDNINNEIKTSTNAVQILEPSDLSSSLQPDDVYDSEKKLAKKTQPTFTSQKPTGPLYNAKPYIPRQPSSTEKGNITLNFEGQNIREVVSTVMTNMLQLNYTISPAVQGQVSLQTSKPINKADLLPLLEKLLKDNGHVMLKDNGLYRIMPLATAAQNSRPLYGKVKTQKPGYQVRIIPLKYISATEMQKRLAPYVQPGGLLEVDTSRNAITLAGTGSEIARMQTIVETFDADWMRGKAIGMYRLKNVEVSEISPELEGIFGESGGTPFSGMFKFIPMEKMNTIMVITSQQSYLNEAKRWIDRLDVSNSSDSERLYVYRVQNGRAENIANVLSSIFSGGSGGSSSSPVKKDSKNKRDSSVAPGLEKGKAGGKKENTANKKPNSPSSNSGALTVTGSNATISADTENNSLIIKATPANYDQVLQALRQIDVPKLQVMIEVVIAEVLLTDDLQYGFKFWLQNNGNLPRQGVSTNAAGGANAVGAYTGEGPNALLAPFANPGFNYTLANISGRLNAQVTALATKNLAKLVSTPYIFVLDNESASINVGEKISITKGSISNDNSTSSTQEYVNTGVSLGVTPRVNAGGSVRLDINQQVSRSVPVAGSNPTILERNIESAIVTRSGQTIALGGLIQESGSISRNGVPILSDIPFLGSLFRGTSDRSQRTELIVLITPHVSHNHADTLDISKEFRAKMKGIDASSRNK